MLSTVFFTQREEGKILSAAEAASAQKAIDLPVPEVSALLKALVAGQGLMIALIFIVTMILAYIFITRTSRPIETLTAFAKDIPTIDFAAEDDERSPIDGLPIQFNDEVGRLAESFVNMSAELRTRVRKLIEKAVARERRGTCGKGCGKGGRG